MLLNDTSLYNQLLRLAKSHDKPVHYSWRGELIDGQRVLPILNITSIIRKSLYLEYLADDIILTCQMTITDKRTLDAAKKRTLQLKLSRQANNVMGNAPATATKKIELYNAHVLSQPSIDIVSSNADLSGSRTDDLTALVDVRIQLTEIGISEFRLIESDGIYHNTTLDNLLKVLYSAPLTHLQGDNFGVNVSPLNNTKLYYQLSIESGIRLIDLPLYLQKQYGLYANGLGYYIQRKQWYFYPLYQHETLKQTDRMLTILNVPENELSGLHNSYIEREGGTFIFATGASDHQDKSEEQLNNRGAGWRSHRRGNIIDRFRDHTKGTSLIPANRNRLDYQFDQRETSLINLRTTKELSSTNPWDLTSEVTAALGSIYTLQWEGSKPELLYPGALVKLLYKANGQLTSLKGSLISTVTESRLDQMSVTNERYTSTSLLTIYASREYAT